MSKSTKTFTKIKYSDLKVGDTIYMDPDDPEPRTIEEIEVTRNVMFERKPDGKLHWPISSKVDYDGTNMESTWLVEDKS